MAHRQRGPLGPGSVAWRVNADPSNAVGGVRALLAQVAHPLVAAGVSQHSGYRDDPWRRLDATAAFVATVTYGDDAAVERAGAMVRRVHEGVHGVDEVTGKRYDARDPELLLWVHATLVHSLLIAYRRCGGWLPSGQAERYVAEMAHAGTLVGIAEDDVPRTRAELRAELEKGSASLRSSPGADDVLRFVLDAPVAPVLKPASRVVVEAALALLPSHVRAVLGVDRPVPVAPAAALAAAAMISGLRAATSVPRAVLGPARFAAVTRPLQSAIEAPQRGVRR